MPLATAEREVLGASHADVAAYLLALWDLPHALIEPIALHQDARRLGTTGMDVTAALALADVLAHEVAGEEPDAGAPAVLARLAPLGDLAAWRALARTAWAGLQAAEARA
jgi:HD-like signal output (HDOD) protein